MDINKAKDCIERILFKIIFINLTPCGFVKIMLSAIAPVKA